MGQAAEDLNQQVHAIQIYIQSFGLARTSGDIKMMRRLMPKCVTVIDAIGGAIKVVRTLVPLIFESCQLEEQGSYWDGLVHLFVSLDEELDSSMDAAMLCCQERYKLVQDGGNEGLEEQAASLQQMAETYLKGDMPFEAGETYGVLLELVEDGMLDIKVRLAATASAGEAKMEIGRIAEAMALFSSVMSHKQGPEGNADADVSRQTARALCGMGEALGILGEHGQALKYHQEHLDL